jgi:hypothetical protein
MMICGKPLLMQNSRPSSYPLKTSLFPSWNVYNNMGCAKNTSRDSSLMWSSFIGIQLLINITDLTLL